jgi:hypothetical protein
VQARVELDDRPQRLTLRVRSVRLGGVLATTMNDLTFSTYASWLATWAEAGMAGSDVFTPGSGVGRGLSPPREPGAPDWRTPAEVIPFFESERVFEIAGVAPAVLARWVHAIGQRLAPLAELSLVGERPASDPPTTNTIDTPRVTRWLRGELEGEVRPHPLPLPFEVTDRGQSGRVLAVWFSTLPQPEALQRFDSVLDSLGPSAHVDVMRAEVAGLVVVWMRDAAVSDRPPGDVASMRAVAMNGLVRLGGVARVEWALGVAGEDGTPVPRGVDLPRWCRG